MGIYAAKYAARAKLKTSSQSLTIGIMSQEYGRKKQRIDRFRNHSFDHWLDSISLSSNQNKR